MDLASLLVSVCLVLLCLQGETRRSNADVCPCPCTDPPARDLTESIPATNCCHNNGAYRYTCKNGYVRKVGTSNLIKCKQTAKGQEWSTPTLTCILDPKRTTTQQPKITSTTVLPSTDSEIRPRTVKQHPVKKIQQANGNTTISSSSQDNIQLPHTTTPASHQGSDAIDPTKVQQTNRETTISSSSQDSSHLRDTATPASQLGAGTIGISALAALLIICVLMGIGFFCYKWRSRNNSQQQQAEELTPMNPEENLPSTPAS